MRRWFLSALLLIVVVPALAQDPSVPTVQRLVPKVINSYPHDTTSFTEGLIFSGGNLYESAGLYGKSRLFEVDPTTGKILRDIPVNRPKAQLDAGQKDYFAEGLSQVGDKLIQLTWVDGEAFVYDINTFERQDTLKYEGEGWGLCNDGKYFYMSNSTSYLSLRDLNSFDLIVNFLVTYEGKPLQPQLLNELECVDESIYANLWQTDFIVQIDKANGNITGLIDTTNLLTTEEKAALGSGQVLNGIAYNPATKTFFITGKQWPKIFEVEFVPAPAEK